MTEILTIFRPGSFQIRYPEALLEILDGQGLQICSWVLEKSLDQ